MASVEQALSKEQEIARAAIVDSLKMAPRGQRRLIVLLGLPGIGKSFLSERLNNEVIAGGGFIADGDLFGYIPSYDSQAQSRKDQMIQHQGPLVVLTTPQQYEDFYFQKNRADILSTHIMKGLDFDEAKNHLGNLLAGRQTVLPLTRLAEYSMGVTRLLEALAQNPNLSELVVAQMSANYLGAEVPDLSPDGLKTFIEKFLLVPPRSETLNDIQRHTKKLFVNGGDYFSFKLFEYSQNIPQLISAINKHNEETGDTEESPEFVDPASIEIYDKRATGDYHISTSAIIYIPALTADLYKRLARSIGFGDHYCQGTRLKLFGNPTGKGVLSDSAKSLIDGYSNMEEVCTDFYNRVHGLNLTTQEAMARLTDSSNQWVVLRTFFHDRRPFYDVFGHMVESKLQQMGLRYATFYPELCSFYGYDPIEKRMRELPEQPNPSAGDH